MTTDGSGAGPGWQLRRFPYGLTLVPTAGADRTPVRIGDVERDQAVTALGDHFAAGRLTRDELDERIDRAMAARFSTDLAPLFADLPRPVAAAPAPRRPVVSPWPLFLLLPVLLSVVLVAAVVAESPWVLWLLLWVFLASRLLGRPRRR